MSALRKLASAWTSYKKQIPATRVHLWGWRTLLKFSGVTT